MYSSILIEESARHASNALRYLVSLLEQQANEPELVTTLQTFFEQGQRRGQSAAALGIHPNTLNYRIERIEALLGAPRRRRLDCEARHRPQAAPRGRSDTLAATMVTCPVDGVWPAEAGAQPLKASNARGRLLLCSRITAHYVEPTGYRNAGNRERDRRQQGQPGIGFPVILIDGFNWAKPRSPCVIEPVPVGYLHVNQPGVCHGHTQR